MCLAIPMEVKTITGDKGMVEAGGVKYEVSFRLLPGARPGDFVIVHAGFAIQKLDAADAAESIKLFHEIEEAEGKTEDA
jgi:hydrogenase expression/formation protein HypC